MLVQSGRGLGQFWLDSFSWDSSQISSRFLRALGNTSRCAVLTISLPVDGYLACRKQSSDKSRAVAHHAKHFQADPFPLLCRFQSS